MEIRCREMRYTAKQDKKKKSREQEQRLSPTLICFLCPWASATGKRAHQVAVQKGPRTDRPITPLSWKCTPFRGENHCKITKDAAGDGCIVKVAGAFPQRSPTLTVPAEKPGPGMREVRVKCGIPLVHSPHHHRQVTLLPQ